MGTLPRQSRESSPPPGLTLEARARSLASLSLTGHLLAGLNQIVLEWHAMHHLSGLGDHGIYPIRQVLFHGPPGNGKTSACQWLAARLNCPLYRIRCESLIDGVLGATTSSLAKLMRWLADQGPAIVLLDEVESIFIARGNVGQACDREIARTMTVFWQYLDRWEGRHLFVFATNMPEQLDAALLSRIETKLEFGPPTADQVQTVVQYWAEVLHEYDPEQWAPALIASPHESFRSLWQDIQRAVRCIAIERALEP